MAGRPIRIGDQLVLEEDYDENYIPSEHGKRPQGCRDSSVRVIVSDFIFVLVVQRRERAQGCSGLLSIFGLDPGLASPGLKLAFVNKVLLGNGHTSLFMCCVWLLSHCRGSIESL